jgi:hypothetical protein
MADQEPTRSPEYALVQEVVLGLTALEDDGGLRASHLSYPPGSVADRLRPMGP